MLHYNLIWFILLSASCTSHFTTPAQMHDSVIIPIAATVSAMCNS
jgi:hypothetical protein